MIDPKFLEFATPEQKKILLTLEEVGSQHKTAKALGIHRRTVERTLKRVQAKAALAGYSPEHDMTHTAPATHFVKGVSSYYNKENKLAGQWVKTDVAREKLVRQMLEIIEEAAEDLPRLKPAAAPKNLNKDLCALYTITDAHVGMAAWKDQGGQDWDLEIAERVLVGAFKYLIDAAPEAETGIIAQLGDLLHYDGLLPVTPTSRHILDAAGGFSEMAHMAVRILRRIVSMALTKHKKVVLVLAEGNHDMASSVWLRIMFKALFENEPRVEIIDSEVPYYAYKHGKVLLAWHHGHIKKLDQLPLLIATEFREMWADVKVCEIHTGDKHHDHVKTLTGATVIQHTTLAARDAYTARHGWHSERAATAYVYHAERGKIGTLTIDADSLAA